MPGNIASFAALGIGAGLASALMAASGISGSALALALVWFAPMPLMIAGLGWHWLLAALGACAGAAALSAAVASPLGLSFFATTGIPAAGLAFLAINGASVHGGSRMPRPGLLVLAASLYTAVVALGTMLMIDTSLEAAQKTMALRFERMLRWMLQIDPAGPLVGPGKQDLSDFPRIFAEMLPVLQSTALAMALLVSLWLAGKVAAKSGRLGVEWPIIANLRLPPVILPVFAAGVLLSFTSGYTGLAGSLIIAAAVLAFSLQGFAALHHLSRSLPGRGFLLFMAWFLVLTIGFPVFLLTFLGLAEHFFDLRKLKRALPPNAT